LSSNLPTVVLIGTGGTIAGAGGSAARSSHYQPAKFTVQDLVKAVPHLEQLARLEAIQVAQKASFDIDRQDWAAIANAVNSALARPEVAGVVVTHGTDTLEETAFFLHLTATSEKPVVVCGAMRPGTAYSADGPANLLNAVTVALEPTAKHRGAMVVMNERIHSARHVVKAHCSSVVAFESRSAGEIGYVSDGHARFVSKVGSASMLALQVDKTLPKVEIAYGYVDADPRVLDAMIALQPAGLVFAGVGNGNAYTPSKNQLLEARAKGIAIVRATRCYDGWITRNSAQYEDDSQGLITANDLTAQKARILLMLGLANDKVGCQLQALFDYVCER
jgi:L-asparaginase